MKRVQLIEKMVSLFRFKTVFDEKENEYVLYYNSSIDCVCNIEDRTSFEATENHVHLIERLRNREFNMSIPVAQNLGRTMLACLQAAYPQKQFVVYVSIHNKDSMIIRFHQKWEGESYYYQPNSFMTDAERVFMFET